MFWVLQSIPAEQSAFERLKRILTLMDLPHVEVVVRKDGRLMAADGHPDDPEPVIPTDQGVFVCGTYALAQVARACGWQPGAFDDRQLDFDACLAGWGNAMLNADAQVIPLGSLRAPATPVFVRPHADDKAFNGQVVTPEGFADWQARLLAKPSAKRHADTAVLVAPIKPIYREHRFFVVGGQVVTGSLYKQAGQLTTSSVVDDDARAYAQAQVDRWRPMDHFVLDVATTPDGHRIVETNGINMAGFYEIDVGALVLAIEDVFAGGPTRAPVSRSAIPAPLEGASGPSRRRHRP